MYSVGTMAFWPSEDLARKGGASDGAVVAALASHQCDASSNPGVDAICGLSLLLVLSLAPRGFSLGTPVFPSPQKPTVPNSNSTRNQVDEEPLCRYATSKSLYINFIYLFIYLFIPYLLLVRETNISCWYAFFSCVHLQPDFTYFWWLSIDATL